jgi:hypothetical protein
MVMTVIKHKKSFEVKSATPVNTTRISKSDSLFADMKGLLMVWVDDQNSHCIPLIQAIIKIKPKTFSMT